MLPPAKANTGKHFRQHALKHLPVKGLRMCYISLLYFIAVAERIKSIQHAGCSIFNFLKKI
jgi:hypothetical protein